MDPITSGCQSLVLSRWLILVALLMINRIKVMWYPPGIIGPQKLYWDLDGVTHVISGVLVVFLLSFARERHCSRLMKTWNIWLWWRGFLDLCHTICLRGQIATLRNTSEKDVWIGLRVVLRGRAWKLWWNCPDSRYRIYSFAEAPILSVVKLISMLHEQNLVMQNVDQSAGDFIDLLQGLLKYDPANRMTAQEALRHPFFTEGFERRWYSLQLHPCLTNLLFANLLTVCLFCL